MLQYGVDIDALNDAGNTPLHVAAQHGKVSPGSYINPWWNIEYMCTCLIILAIIIINVVCRRRWQSICWKEVLTEIYATAPISLPIRQASSELQRCDYSFSFLPQVAILCGHRLLAKEILHFSSQNKGILIKHMDFLIFIYCVSFLSEPLKVHQTRQIPANKGAAPISTASPPHSTSTLPSKGKKANRPDHSEVHVRFYNCLATSKILKL